MKYKTPLLCIILAGQHSRNKYLLCTVFPSWPRLNDMAKDQAANRNTCTIDREADKLDP